jgi:Ca2+:H+ antiporter
MPWWAWTWPALAWLILALTLLGGGGSVLAAAAAIVLIATVFAAVYGGRAPHRRTIRHNRLGGRGNAALASIGLTIPAVAVLSVVLNQPITLGLGEKDEILLTTLLISVITLGTGRTTVLQGIVHLAIFAVFLFFAIVP